jgi:pyruvate/2-oxoglutarate dehydrogenase complex dihydrolipoamide dehydrogenase (E3) component
MAAERYDAIIIGAGQAGGPLSTALARTGKHTAIIEREHVGGTCINEGCTPTKTMVASARVAYLARRGADYGVQTAGPLSIDMRTVRQRKRDIVNDFRNGSQHAIEETPGVDLLMGEATFTGTKTLDVHMNDGTTRSLTADLICINTGDRPSVPRVSGITDMPYLTSTSIMELDAVPDHLLIIGGGYIGLEFGQMFRRFGSRVTIIQHGKQLLSKEDADVAEAVEQILKEDGVEVLLNSSPEQVQRGGDSSITLTVRTPEGTRTLTGSHLLAAAGRTPNTDHLNLAATGVQMAADGTIPVDDTLATNVPGIYALGDVKGGPAFTHISYDDFRIMRRNLIGGEHATIAGRLVPYTVFIDPQLGRVGMSETEARQAGRRIRVAKMPMSNVARALEVAETRGFMKAIVDVDSGKILGCAVLGIEGGEIMSMLEIAMLGDLPYTVSRDTIFAHPTLAESLNNLFTSLDEE